MPLTKSIVYKQDQVQAANGEQVQLKDGTMITPMFMMRFGDFYCYWCEFDKSSGIDICSHSCAKTYASKNSCCVIEPLNTPPGFDIITPDTETHEKYAFKNNLKKRPPQRGNEG